MQVSLKLCACNKVCIDITSKLKQKALHFQRVYLASRRAVLTRVTVQTMTHATLQLVSVREDAEKASHVPQERRLYLTGENLAA